MVVLYTLNYMTPIVSTQPNSVSTKMTEQHDRRTADRKRKTKIHLQFESEHVRDWPETTTCYESLWSLVGNVICDAGGTIEETEVRE